jgi:hypothetical protein
MKLSHEALAAELTNHLVPGAILIPAPPSALPELQRRFRLREVRSRHMPLVVDAATCSPSPAAASVRGRDAARPGGPYPDAIFTPWQKGPTTTLGVASVAGAGWTCSPTSGMAT